MRNPRARALALGLALQCALVQGPLSAQANPFTSGARGPGLNSVRLEPTQKGLLGLQTDLRNALADFFFGWKQGASPRLLWSVLGLAFTYGILHAAGPGHRKTVVFSLFLAKKAGALEPLGLGLLLSGLHAGASIALMLAVKGLGGAISGRSSNISLIAEGVSYILLALMGLALFGRALIDLVRRRQREADPMGLGALILSGLYPCPGAILILVLALNLGIFGLGIWAVLAMSLGMSLPIIATGYLAWAGRIGLFTSIKRAKTHLGLISGLVELAGYAMLCAFSCYIAWPFLFSLFHR